MNVYSNWKRSDQETKVEEIEDGYSDDVDEVFGANFVDFCRGDMPVYYIYCAWTKFRLLSSTPVSMPKEAQYSEESKSRK